MSTKTIADVAKGLSTQGQTTSTVHQYSNTGSRECDPDCPVCGGYVWVSLDVPVSDPRFGKLQPCRNSRLVVNELLTGMTPAELSMDWVNVLPNGNIATAANTIKTVLERGYGWVYLWGNNGLGKTLLLQLAVATYYRLRKQGAYVRMVEIVDHLKDAYDAKNPSAESQRRLDLWAEMPLLCIDEFDRIQETEWLQTRRFILMDRRYTGSQRKQSITIMASNLAPNQWAEDYLCSRIYDGLNYVIEVSGQDFRIHRKGE